MIKVFVVFGTRPEFLKLAPVMAQLEASPNFAVTTVFTGQHSKDVLGSNLFFGEEAFDEQLQVMRHGQSLAELSARILVEISIQIEKHRPDICIVHGDTTTALSAAMAAFYLGVPIAHIEAGLRTRNLRAPFPEELNRQVIGRLATWNFAPTLASKANLLEEAVDPKSIFVTGNTIVDTLQLISSRVINEEHLSQQVKTSLGLISPRLLESDKLVLVTAHRRENHAVGIREICLGIAKFAVENPDYVILFAMHPNPVVQNVVTQVLSHVTNVILTGPLGYGEFVYLLSHCAVVVTDSGGIQEEAVSLGKVVLVTRDSTERSEGIESGLLKVVGAYSNAIAVELERVAQEVEERSASSTTFASSPYGDGKASERIARVLAGEFTDEFEPPSGGLGQGSREHVN